MNTKITPNKLLKKILLFLFAVFIYHISFAQANQTKERIQSMKVSFITQKLNLTPEEAQVFWPVYNQYQKRLDDLRNSHRKDISKYKEAADALSDKEVENVVDNEIIFKQKELDIQKEMHTKVKSILPIKKVAKLYQAEEQFKLKLI